ncbi:MAG TPA: nicotinamide riboside transporter PnuC [Steroidobacteraceae bacterium]|nr:nicotinamide riboside transporter PnuC [Steroidobacteraceae bacterium]
MTLPAGLLKSLEIFAMLTGAGYAILAARRNRLCWVAGAVSSLCAALLAGLRALPMQSALQVFFVGMSVYGWLSWTRSAAAGELPVGLWPHSWHLGAALVVIALSFVSASLLATGTQAAWPLLDSLTTWFSLLATWLAARARLENWLYWIAIDGVLVYLFYVQDLPFLALLNLLFIGIAVGGFIAWRRRLQAQSVPA